MSQSTRQVTFCHQDMGDVTPQIHRRKVLRGQGRHISHLCRGAHQTEGGPETEGGRRQGGQGQS